MLKQSSKRNKQARITAMLSYKDGQFMQPLEGTAKARTATFRLINQNSRHKVIMVLVEGTMRERRFPD